MKHVTEAKNINCSRGEVPEVGDNELKSLVWDYHYDKRITDL